MATNYNNNKFLKVKVHLKEKSTYQYSSSYFGLPIYVMVPKENLTYGVLYDCIMNSLKRFVKADTQADTPSALNTSSEEINSKLSDSLNVKDEEFDDETAATSSSSKKPTNGAAEQPKNSDDEEPCRDGKKQDQSVKFFHMLFCKIENTDYDNNAPQVAYTDDTPLDWQNLFAANTKDIYAASQSNQTLSVIADFGQKFSKRFYSKKPFDVNVYKLFLFRFCCCF